MKIIGWILLLLFVLIVPCINYAVISSFEPRREARIEAKLKKMIEENPSRGTSREVLENLRPHAEYRVKLDEEDIKGAFYLACFIVLLIITAMIVGRKEMGEAFAEAFRDRVTIIVIRRRWWE